ncbi:MAG TPA: BTAD domain-containing putative transcriptional regulator [Actinomycetota bacterium]|nr:BTAD domain-containing putative transcriptional regulator [Actinomycetota bacterium]
MPSEGQQATWGGESVAGHLAFRLLGPLEVTDGGRLVPLAGPRQRLVLAHLLLAANRVVTMDELIDRVWDEDPPRAARNTIQSYVSHLRTALGPDRVEGRSPGYLIHAEPDELDVLRFEQLLRRARRLLPTDPREAAGKLEEALGLWVGSPLSDLADAPSLDGEIARLKELRVSAIEDLVGARLSVGQHAEVLPDLERLVREHPLRERLWAHLMLARYRSGRQAEALDAFRQAQELLADELGIDPSPELQELQRQILLQELGEGPQATGGGQRTDSAIRTFLIADVRGYTVFTQERGDEAAAELAGRFADLAREVIELHAGTLVELRGDEALVVFDSARQAIRASIELQRRFVDATVADPSLPFPVGIGLDAGEAVAVGTGFRGGALNLAARLCSIAGPAEIFASREVVHLARKVEGVAYVDRGSVQLKGLADPVQVIRLRAEAADPSEDLAFRRALGSAATTLTPAVPGAIVPNPYKGLRAFDEADAADFFGREQLVEQLVKRLGTTRFLAVVGPSGSGKSSVVRAGLLPAIRRGAIPASDHWRIADMFPGVHPLDGLEAALLRAVPDPPASLMDQLERDEHGLHRAVLRLLPSDGSELVLVIDQFEEVFTLVEDEAVRTHFLGSLEVAATDPRSRLRVVATLRADFYDRPLLYRGFAELFKSRVEAVIPLSAQELEKAISGPAKRVDVSLEPGLVAAMVADVAEEPGALPLMEYALTELFDRRDGRTLFLEAYREIGGVSGALGRRAEELYADLDDDGKEAARQLFLRLVALGEGAEDTRRRVPRSEVASLDVDQQAMAMVLDTFGASRQLSFDRDAKTGAPTIELAHEAILTAWPRLHRWIDAAREELRTERRVAAAAREWTESGSDPSFLLGGSRLDQAQAWRAGSGIAVTPEEREYLDASLDQRDRTLAEEQARQAHEEELERRSFRRLRALVAVLAVAAVVAIGLTFYATRQGNRAASEERTATARELAAASAANLEVDPERSILLALEAIEVTRSVDGSVLPEAEEALHHAMIASRIVLTREDLGGTVDWSPMGVFVTEGLENTGMIDLRDEATGDSVRSWVGHEGSDVNDVQFSEDGTILASAGDDGFLKMWDPDSGNLISSVRGRIGVVGQSFDRTGRLVAATWPEEGAVRVAEVATGTIVSRIDLDIFPFESALSPDGTRLVVAGPDTDSLPVFDVRTGDLVVELENTPSVNTLSWSPDGRWIATGDVDSSVRIWNSATGALEEQLLGHTGIVISVDWSSDSRRVVSGGTDGTARIWELEPHPNGQTVEVVGRQVHLLAAQGTQSGVYAAFSPDGQRVLTGDVGIAAVKIWDLSIQGDAELVNIPTDPALVDAAYLPDGRIVASHDGGSVGIWTIDREATEPAATLGPAGGSDLPVFLVAPSPDGELVAMARDLSTVVSVWNVRTGTLHFDYDARTNGITSMDWSSDGRYLAVGIFDGRLQVFDAEAGGRRTLVGSEPEPHQIRALAFAPDGRTIATASFNQEVPDTNHVSIWDRKTGEVVHELDGSASSLTYDGSGERLAIGSYDGTVQIRGAATGDIERSFRAGSVTVMNVVFSPDGELLATGGEDATIRVFDLGADPGPRLLALRGHASVVSGLDFSPDGKQLVSASPDEVVHVWALDLDDLITIADEEVTRRFTDDECRQYLHLPEGCS